MSKGKEMGRTKLYWVCLAVLEDLFRAIVKLGENRFEADFKLSTEQGRIGNLACCSTSQGIIYRLNLEFKLIVIWY